MDLSESQGVVQAYTQELGLTFPTLMDGQDIVARQYRVQGVPTSLFITREGVIQVRHTGPLDESLLEKYLEKIL